MANLIGADLSCLVLESVALKGTILRNANMQVSNLSNADLSHTAMGGAELRGAWLGDADLLQAVGVTSVTIAQAAGNANTRLPDELEKSRPSHWNLPLDEQLNKVNE